MGNRATIVSYDTTKENKHEKIGIYVHWFGSPDNIERALATAKDKNIRGIDTDRQYFWARFCQVFANIISEETGDNESGIGIDIVSHLDNYNGDNGVYYIDKHFEIVKHTTGKELY